MHDRCKQRQVGSCRIQWHRSYSCNYSYRRRVIKPVSILAAYGLTTRVHFSALLCLDQIELWAAVAHVSKHRQAIYSRHSSQVTVRLTSSGWEFRLLMILEKRNNNVENHDFMTRRTCVIMGVSMHVRPCVLSRGSWPRSFVEQ